MATLQPLVREPQVRTGIVCAALLVSSAACAGLGSSAPADVDLAGTWLLNTELSDDPHEVFEKSRAQMKERTGSMHGAVRVAGGSGTVGSVGVQRHGNPGAGHPEGAQRLESPAQIEIEHGEEAMTLKIEASSESCRTTETTQVSTPGGGVADRRCGWDGEAFVIEIESPEGFTRRDSYALSEDGTQLIVTTKLEGKRMPGSGMTIRRVYDRAQAS